MVSSRTAHFTGGRLSALQAKFWCAPYAFPRNSGDVRYSSRPRPPTAVLFAGGSSKVFLPGARHEGERVLKTVPRPARGWLC